MLKTNITHLIVTTMLVLLASGFLFSSASQADSHDSFNTEWRMPADDLTLTFPSEGSYSINWGDGTIEEVADSNPTHTYATTGDYTVTASNTITRFNLNNDAENRAKLIDIQQWGTAEWTSMERAFYGASNMTMSASDSPDLAAVTTMFLMFSDASTFNGNIGDWNVAGVTNMRSMFQNASAFNQDLSDWDVASVINMALMFSGASAFNGDIGDWNVANVTSMSQIFTNANAFSQNLGRWYVDETVADLQTENPNYDGVNDLNVLSFNFVAQNAVLRSQTPSYALATGAAAEGSDNARFTLTSNTLRFRSGGAADDIYTIRIAVGSVSFGSSNSIDLTVFVRAFVPTVSSIGSFITVWRMPADDLDLTFPGEGPGEDSYTINWGDGITEAITASSPTHTYATAGDYIVTATNAITRFNLNNNSGSRDKLIDIQQWGIANWISMRGAFYGASAMTMSASDSPDLGGVTDMSFMFRDASAFNQDIGGWDVAGVTNISGIFLGASAFNQDIGGWNVAQVTDMSFMFRDASAFNQDIGDWNVAGVTNMSGIFLGASVFNQDIGGWNVAQVTAMPSMFFSAIAFNQDIGGWNVAGVTNMFRMFNNADVFNQNIGGWNVAKVTNMSSMFRDADVFSQNLGRWYVDETIDNDQGMLQTANPNYDGVNDLNVLNFNFIAQNTVLRDQNPTYTLAADTTDNARFTLDSNTLSFINLDEAADGTYTVRIAVDNTDFGSSNSIDLTVDVSGTVADARLSALTLSTDTLTPVFASGTLEYTVSVANAVTSLSVTPTVSDSNASFVISGTAADGTTALTVNSNEVSGLTEGANSISIAVTTQDTVQTYTVTVTRLSLPAAPRNLAIDTTRTSFNSLSFSWQPPEDSDAADINGYRIERAADDSGSPGVFTELVADTGTASLVYTDVNLLEDSTYHYRVTALSLAGTGEPSASVSAMTLTRPPDIFITEWRMPSDDLTLTFPSEESSYTINWGDGTTENITSNNPEHTYTTAGDYTVTAANTITRFNLNDGEDKEKLINIQQWGTANWTSMADAFFGASAMTMSASDSPNLDGVTDMSGMFLSARAFNQDIGGWNVARVTDMSRMFSNARAFNQDIGSWNVARVTDMPRMFSNARAFNQDIGGWNIARVTDMSNMFSNADAFNQNLGRWYVDETIDNDQGMLQTANPSYDGVNDLNVLRLNFVAQNTVLRAQTPIYTLVTGADAEGTDNARFILASNTLSFNSGMAADGTYTVRIAVGGVAFGSSNSIELIIVVDGGPPTVTSIVRTTPLDETTKADILIWTLTFSENVQNVDATDFRVSGTTATPTVTGLDAVYQLTVTGGDLAELNGTVTLAFADDQDIADTLDNALTATTPTGDNQPSYTLDNAGVSLSALALSTATATAATLDPVFSSGTLAYTVSIANAVTSLTVTPTVFDSNASFVISATATDGSVLSVNTSGQISGLTVGDNTISITVTAQDTSTVQT
ncbi:MAG: BspA family leucine-rich repeat surface protein, partial [Methylococcales symbiont of Iophon sp. n. MRB-2018]